MSRCASGWLCDGHGYWISPMPDCDIMTASEARRRGAPVPDDEADPEPMVMSDDPECPF